jgi:BirA family transcriptional regulator, biotin operon repressor / biotin---[acetyl-CoA-carboxylase] ligase
MTIDTVRVMRETAIARVEYHPTVDSTNTRAAQCASQGAVDLPLLVVADEQTAGRGRGGNRWWTGPGALAFSLLVDAQTVAADESRSPLVALATAVAIVDCVTPLLPTHQVGIHWPNDVYVRAAKTHGGPNAKTHGGADATSHGGADTPVCQKNSAADRKLAGILVEVLPDRRHVIGIGLNLNNTLTDAPAELRSTVATLYDLAGCKFDRTAILIDLLRRLDEECARLREDTRGAAARADQLCLQRGHPVTLGWANRKVTGLCQGIAVDGGLQLETASGVESHHSGTVLDNADLR